MTDVLITLGVAALVGFAVFLLTAPKVYVTGLHAGRAEGMGAYGRGYVAGLAKSAPPLTTAQQNALSAREPVVLQATQLSKLTGYADHSTPPLALLNNDGTVTITWTK